MNIDTEDHIRALGTWFAQTGTNCYMVGGYVRNRLLSLPLSDMDICAAYPAQRLPEIADADFTVTERSYGLGTVVILQRYGGGRYEYEYTAMRKDSYGRGGTHRPDSVVFTDKMEEDAARRDFTVNALYAKTDGEVADPLGRGLDDIGSKTIRMCAQETMEEDALRTLRMVRFAAELGFSIEKETYLSAERNADNLRNISAERIRDEFLKIIMADTKYGNKDAVLYGLQMLKQLGALRYIAPLLLEGGGFAQNPEYHRYDVLEHGIHACAAACPDVRVRLAALLHDISKPTVFRRDGNMYDHPRSGAAAAGDTLRSLRVENTVVRDVEQLVAQHMFDLDNRAGRKAVMRMIVRLGREQFLRLCCLREADFEGSGMGNKAESAVKWRHILEEMEQQGAPLRQSELAVDGNDIMRELRIPPGRRVGDILSRLHMYALKKPQQNNYKSLIRCAKMLYTGQGSPEC